MKTLATRTNCNKIGLDFHGVINQNPSFFKQLSRGFMQRGFEVHIISGGPKESITDYLREHRFYYTSIWCIFDYYEQKDKITVFADGSFHMDDELWNEAKALYCLKNNICLHIDDSTVYGDYFTTPYCLYDAQTMTGTVNNRLIDFSSSADKTLEEIFSFLSSINNAEAVFRR